MFCNAKCKAKPQQMLSGLLQSLVAACLVALIQFGDERVKAVAQGERGPGAAEGLLSGKGVL